MEEKIKELENRVKYLEQKRISQLDVNPKAIKQPAIDGLILFTGLEADKPDGTSEKLFYFATDTFKLWIWTGSAWKYIQAS